MDIFNNKICEKHNLEAKQMCTKQQCFHQTNILVCKQCISQHSDHPSNLIDVSLLNEKVHQLMKKRMDFQTYYQKSCDAMVTQLKKFKVFKQEIVSALNWRERSLNELCKKIRKNIPYEKDKHLFKNHLGYVYLAMKGINPNLDLYRNFRHNIFETLAECRKALHRLELNMAQVPMLLTKQHQICSVLKKVQQESVPPVQYFEPHFRRFKKETVKLNAPNAIHQWKLHRVSGDQFIAYSKETKFAKWYNMQNVYFPKLLSVGSHIQHMEILNKNAYLTNQVGGIIIYDLLNETIVKQYASSNHKNASITSLLALSHSHVLNFITCPNQIVCLNYDEQNQTLRMVQGVQTKSRALSSVQLQDKFVSVFDDKTVKLYNSEHMQKESQIQFQSLMKSVAKINEYTYLLGGQSNQISLVDSRTKGVTCKIRVSDHCQEIKKIYPLSVMTINGNNLKIFDIRAQKQLFSSRSDQHFKHLEVLNSGLFVTSGRQLNLWQGQ